MGDEERFEYVGGPWDGLDYHERNMHTKAYSRIPHPDGGMWGRIRYQKDPLTGSYLFVERLGE